MLRSPALVRPAPDPDPIRHFGTEGIQEALKSGVRLKAPSTRRKPARTPKKPETTRQETKSKAEVKEAQKIVEPQEEPSAAPEGTEPVEPPKPRAYCGDEAKPYRRMHTDDGAIRVVPKTIEPRPEAARPIEPAKPKAPQMRDSIEDEYDRNREADRARLNAPAPPLPTGATAARSTSQAPAPQGALATPDMWNKWTKRGRETALKARGTFKTGFGRGGAAASPPEKDGKGASARPHARPALLKSDLQQRKVPSARKKAGSGKRQQESKSQKTARSAPPVEVTEKTCREIALAALSNFKSPNVTNLLAVLAVLIGQRTSRESRQREEIVAYLAKLMMKKLTASFPGGWAPKRDLQTLAMSLLGERIAAAWSLVRDLSAVPMAEEERVARRLAIARKASRTPETTVLEALLTEENGREIVFIVKQGARGYDLIYGAMFKRRFDWWLNGHDASPLAQPTRRGNAH